MKEIDIVLEAVNVKLQQTSAAGEPYIVTFQGRPSHQVESIDPLIMTRYGLRHNRAPRIAGEMALLGFAAANHPYGNRGTRTIRSIYEAPNGSMYAAKVQASLVNEVISEMFDLPLKEYLVKA